jgi:hypothetical protein
VDDIGDVGVFLGLDVGKSAHHGHGLTPAGKKVFDKQLPNSEPKLRAVFDKPAAKLGIVLVIVDQPASIGALPLTVARAADCKVAYLPGLSMHNGLAGFSRSRPSTTSWKGTPVNADPVANRQVFVRGVLTGAYQDHGPLTAGHCGWRDGADQESGRSAETPGAEDQQVGVLSSGQQGGGRSRDLKGRDR